MNKFNSVGDNGDCQLPPGFRFEPTDEEVVYQYLVRKTFSQPLPASVIPEIDASRFHDPSQIPGNSDRDRYFFCSLKTDKRGASRAACGGFWKDTGSDKRIVSSKRMPLVGIKKTLVFYKLGKHAVRTDWIMHAYYIALLRSAPCYPRKRTASQGSLIRVGNWALCHVFEKKRSTKAEVYHFLTQELSDHDAEEYSSSTASTAGSSSSSKSDSSIHSEVSSSASSSSSQRNLH